MKILDIQTGRISLPLARPFKTALRTVETLSDIVVRVITDEGEGYGEAPPTAVITGDTDGSILCAVHDYIRPALVGMDVLDLPACMEKLNACMVHNTTPKAAVDMALYDLWARAQKKPLYQLLGGARASFKTDITISVNPVFQMVEDSLDAVKQGFDILKVKVGKEGEKDVERIAAIREAVGPNVQLRVDANQGWEAKEAVRIIRAMEDRGLCLDLVEQPVPAMDTDGLEHVTRNVETPILADEAVFSPRDAENIILRRAADLINIKLMKTGGIWNALKICRMAEEHGVECMLGCMLESRLSVAAAAHLAAGQKIVTRADLDGPSLCAIDPYAGGPEFEGAVIRMTDDAGVGVRGVPCEFWN